MSSSLDIPSRLAGYRIERELGRGGMGRVYEAEHLHLRRRLALKVLAPHLAEDESFRERFVRESQLLAAIDHPNIIPIYDAGEAEGLLYIAMRYVEGYDLKLLIEREGQLEADRTVEIVEQLADALDAAHARDLVHRDVKPANVLIEEGTQRIFLTDFGLAKRLSSGGLSGAGLFLGTVDYASPEQIEGRPVGAAADVYGLGCLLYECLVGKGPFAKETDVAVVHAHLLEPPPQVTATRPELASALDDVIARALAKREQERYATCGDLAAAARRALGGAPPTIVAAAAIAESVAILRQAGPVRSTLPSQATPFLGREADLDAVRALLLADDVRLVTLTGPGGTGKTRLAVESAGSLEHAFPDGLFFVDLSSLSDPALVGSRIAHALGVEERVAGGADVLDALREHIRGQRLLLVLDNFEQVLPAAPVVAEVLTFGRRHKALVTSRGSLRLNGEREYPVLPLPLPEADDVGDPGAALQSAAVALFVERARAARPEFALTGDNASVVVEICTRLDGLPLAIELAAAWIKLLTPEETLARLEHRLELLTGGGRDRPSRHQTLREAIDWSYELLDPDEQVLLARLAVFAGGCTLAAAEAIAGDHGDPMQVIEGLSSLVDKSLLRRRDATEGRSRMTMLQTIQEYALYRLIERRELEDLRSRHAEYYLALAEEAEPELVGPDQDAWVRRLDEETANLRSALTWSLESDELELGLRIAGALPRLWSIRGHMTEGRRWLEQALERDGEVAPSVRAKALFAAGYAALGQGDYTSAATRFEESLALYRELGDSRGIAMSLAQLGWLSTTRGQLEPATARSEESLALAREIGDKRTASVALSNLAEAAASRDEHGLAAELFEDALGLRRDVGDRRNIANALLNLGRTELARREYDHATAVLEEGLQLARELEDTWSISVGVRALAQAALHQGDRERAAALLTEGLATARKRGDKRIAAECLHTAGGLAAADADPVRAARLWGAAEALRESTGAAQSPAERAVEDEWLVQVRNGLGDEQYEHERSAGRELDLDQASQLVRA